MKRVKQNAKSDKAAFFAEALLGWYDRSARVLPWRYLPGARPDPYRVWLSEIMLQQTTVSAVIPYFLRFTERWPDVHALARAEPEALMAAWAGLGYYARARNLLACARRVSYEFGGVFPEDEKALRSLPGIGDYTSAAIRAIAFNKDAVVVDGNVERVISRLYPDLVQNPKDKRAVKALAGPYYEYSARAGRSGDLAQAFMDLGAGICIPKVPRCGLCPVSAFCGSAGRINSQNADVRGGKPLRRARFGYVYWLEDEEGGVLLHRRPPKGLLGGMVGLPVSEWVDIGGAFPATPDFIRSLPLERLQGAEIRHTFTHFDLTLEVYKAKILPGFAYPAHYFFWNRRFEDYQGFPSVFAKVVKLINKP